MQRENRQIEIFKVLSNETKLGILFSLQFYDALNLKQISNIAGMKEPSAFEHIKGRGSEKGLLELGLIEEDKSHKGRGKYYRLTDIANNLFQSINAGIKDRQMTNTKDNDIAELINFNDLNNIKIITKFFSSIAIIVKNLAIYTANFVEQQISKEEEIKENLNDQIYINFSYLELKTNEQKKKLNDIFNKFGESIHEISKESKELELSEIDEKYLIYTFSTSLNLIDPRNR